MRVACLAETKHAASASAATSAEQARNVSWSVALDRSSPLAGMRPTIAAAARPKARPTATGVIDRRTKCRTTRVRGAPSASRRPISRARRAAAQAVALYTPTEASSSASPANAPSNVMRARSHWRDEAIRAVRGIGSKIARSLSTLASSSRMRSSTGASGDRGRTITVAA